MQKRNKPFKVIVAGSRDFHDYKFLKEKLDKILSEVQDEIIIVSGTAGGADKLGERYAKENGYAIDRHPAPWEEIEDKHSSDIGRRRDGTKYWKTAGLVRNVLMAEISDACVVFRIRMSSGSTHMIDTAKEYKLLLRYFDI